jgi:hypothetical protein
VAVGYLISAMPSQRQLLPRALDCAPWAGDFIVDPSFAIWHCRGHGTDDLRFCDTVNASPATRRRNVQVCQPDDAWKKPCLSG